MVLRAASYGTGALLVLIPAVDWLLTGREPSGWPLLFATGALLLLLPHLSRVPLPVRSGLLVFALFSITVLQGSVRGWMPSIVGASCALVVIASLLLPRRAVVALVLLNMAALLSGGRWAEVHDFGPIWSSLEPTRLSSWMRVALFFVLICGATMLVLRQVRGIIDRALGDAARGLVQAERHAARAREVRAARLEAERALRGPQRVQAVAMLSAGLAHVLNNALTIGRGAIEQLREEQAHASREQAGASIEAAARRVADAVRELMVFARKEGGEPSGVVLREELERVVIGMGSTLRADVRLSVVGDPTATAELSSARLRQLVVALVLNATAAARSGGRIQLAVLPVARGDAEVELVVEDEGEGMAPSVRVRATEAFFSTRDARFHAGLGLTVATGLAEQAGGTLRLESRQGVGTRVRVRLPNAADAPPSSTCAPALLHGRDALEAEPDEEPAEVVAAAEMVETTDAALEGWSDGVVTRLGRVALGTLLVAVAGAAATTGFRYPNADLNLALFAACGVAFVVAGWARAPSGAPRAALLLSAIAALALGQATISSFQAPIVLVALIVTSALVTLLGGWRAALFTVLGLGASLLAIGALWDAGLVAGDLALFTPTRPENWRRIAFTLGAGQAALAAAVLAVMESARRAVERLEASEARLAAAQAEEEREGARDVALERARTNSERLAAVGRAVGVIAHDLNNALQGLISEAECLRDPTLTPEEIATSRALLERAHDYACALATQFGGAVASPERPAAPIELGTAVEQTLEMLPALLRDGTTLRRSIERGCFVAIHEADVRRLLFNLVTNARDALDGHGTIEVTLARSGGAVTLRVRDSGRGMDEATRARVFEAFFSTKPEGKGTGLGLYSVARIMDATSGTIALRTEPRLGTTFELSWPVAAAAQALASCVAAAPEAARGRVVLLVEDEPAVRAYQGRTLRRAGYEVREASDGASALSLIARSPDGALLCVDGGIPGASALEIIEAFRRARPGRPVLVCSGQLPEALTRSGLRGDALSFLPKPFEPAQLRAAVDALALRD